MLGGLERLVTKNYPSLLPKVSTILHGFYSNGILGEDAMLAWGRKASGKYVEKELAKQVRESAAPFLKWLEFVFYQKFDAVLLTGGL